MTSSSTITLQVRIGDRTVEQRLDVSPVELVLAEAIGGRTTFGFRLFKAKTWVIQELLDQRLLDAEAGDAVARHEVGLLLLGLYLDPKLVIESRELELDSLIKAQVLPRLDAGAVSVLHRRLLAEVPPDDSRLDEQIGEQILALTHEQVVENWAEAQKIEVDLVAEVFREHVRFYGLLDAEDFVRWKPSPQETQARERIREIISRRASLKPVVRKILALRSLGAVTRLVDRANRLTLRALLPQLEPAEARAFAFLHLRRRPLRPESNVYFDGILADQPFLRSLWGLAPPSFLAALIVTIFFRAWPESQMPRYLIDLRRQEVALVRGGKRLLIDLRNREAESRGSRRVAGTDPDWIGDDRSSDRRVDGLAEHVAALDSGERERRLQEHLTPKELEVLTLTLDGMSHREIAKKLRISRQAVEKRLRRPLERIKQRRSVD